MWAIHHVKHTLSIMWAHLDVDHSLCGAPPSLWVVHHVSPSLISTDYHVGLPSMTIIHHVNPTFDVDCHLNGTYLMCTFRHVGPHFDVGHLSCGAHL